MFKLIVATAIVVIFIWRIKMHRKNLLCLLSLFLNRDKFITLSVESAIKRECESNSAFKERYEKDIAWKDKQVEDFKKQFSESTVFLRKSIRLAFITVALTSLSAVGLSYLFVGLIAISSNMLLFMQIISAFVILWSTVGKLGYPIETIGGQSLPEEMNKYWFIFLNVIGIFFLFFSQSYSFFKK